MNEFEKLCARLKEIARNLSLYILWTNPAPVLCA